MTWSQLKSADAGHRQLKCMTGHKLCSQRCNDEKAMTNGFTGRAGYQRSWRFSPIMTTYLTAYVLSTQLSRPRAYLSASRKKNLIVIQLHIIHLSFPKRQKPTWCYR